MAAYDGCSSTFSSNSQLSLILLSGVFMSVSSTVQVH